MRDIEETAGQSGGEGTVVTGTDRAADSPAFIRNGRLDVLAVNRLGRALYAPLFADHSVQTVNIARFQFLNPAGRDFFPDWEKSVDTTVSLLRTEAGRAPGDTDLTGLIGELVTRSEEFRTAWAKHNVRLHHTGRKAVRHPAIGEVTLDFDAMELPSQPGLTLTAFSAEPATPAHDALQLLAAWSSTEDASTAADRRSTASSVAGFRSPSPHKEHHDAHPHTRPGP